MCVCVRAHACVHIYVCVDRDGDRLGRDDPVSTLDSTEPFSILPLDLVLPTTSLSPRKEKVL